MSRWTGSSEDAFFNPEIFDRNRILKLPENEYSGRTTKNSYYIVAVDVGRKDCDSVACIIKCIPQAQGAAIKSLVNIYTISDGHFEDQAIALKKLYYKYKARRMVIDANGLGIGLVDYMVKSQVDPETGETLPDFGVYNDNDGEYKKYRSQICEDDAMYLIKANAVINSVAHTAVQTQMTTGKLKFLIDERQAKAKLLGTKVGQNMKPEERKLFLQPFSLTSILKEEIKWFIVSLWRNPQKNKLL